MSELNIFAICGNSGSGKTTLIEQVIPRLLAKGLSVAAVKHFSSSISCDTPGKDSDRLFTAGADVFLHGEYEGFTRFHSSNVGFSASTMQSLSLRYDIVLVEGRINVPFPKVWLLSDGEEAPSSTDSTVISTLSRTEDRVEKVLSILDEWMIEQIQRTPVYGCILIGGKSTRMGMPKHLIMENGKTWLKNTVDVLRPLVHTLIISGEGEIPESCIALTRIPDAPDLEGPIAGILPSMRWSPGVTWLVVACDLPHITPEAVTWLLSARKPGAWAVMPKREKIDRVEPLFALYDSRSRVILENIAADGNYGPSNIANHPKVMTPSLPSHLAAAWDNVNTPLDRG